MKPVTYFHCIILLSILSFTSVFDRENYIARESAAVARAIRLSGLKFSCVYLAQHSIIFDIAQLVV